MLFLLSEEINKERERERKVHPTKIYKKEKKKSIKVEYF